MENQEGDGYTDWISQLPQSIIHQILSLLPQKDAIRTCVLSKSWRYLWYGRPNIKFRPADCRSMSFLDKTLQRYHDQRLSIQDFFVEMPWVNSESIPLLEKWIPIVIMNMSVKTFDLRFFYQFLPYFVLPSVVFQFESLKELHLNLCKFNQINSTDELLLKHLKTLSLKRVYIEDETLEKIMSNCPLIECLVLRRCEGLRTVKLNKTHNLMRFYFAVFIEVGNEHIIETNHIELYHHKNCFPHLKFLCLNSVRLSTESIDNFSRNSPCLENLELSNCYGFGRLQISSLSIKRLTVKGVKNKLVEAVFGAPNILYFEFSGDFPPSSMSFTTTSSDWESYVQLQCDVVSVNDSYLWLLNLNEMLKALSQSQISLDVISHFSTKWHTEGGFHEPVVVEHLGLRGCYSSSSFAATLNGMFSICRPRYTYEDEAQTEWDTEDEELNMFLWKALVQERERRDYFWQLELEEANMYATYDNGVKWDPVYWTHFKKCAPPNKRKISFALKWRA